MYLVAFIDGTVIRVTGPSARSVWARYGAGPLAIGRIEYVGPVSAPSRPSVLSILDARD